MKICPVCKSSFQTKNALKQHMQSKHQSQQKAQPAQSRRPRSQRQAQSIDMRQTAYNDATCHVARTEWLCDVKSDNSKEFKLSTSIEVDGSNLPVLSKLSKLFDRYIVNSISILYKGSVATTRDGVVYFGIDYDGATKTGEVGLSKILKYPNKSAAVWVQEAVLPLKYDKVLRFVKGTDLRDKLGSVICYASTDKENLVLGTLFVKYNVTLMSLSGD